MSSSDDPLDRERLAELLLRWEELWETGLDTPAEELAQEHPQLIPELARRIEALKSVAWMTKPAADESDALALPQPPSNRGRTLGGRYRLETLLAAGGFAEVYRAYDEGLLRTVAIKLPRADRLDSRESFLVEARRVAGLTHEGIVPVHDVCIDGDTCFIVSEFLEGGSVADRLTTGRPSVTEAVRWIGEVADALDYAHLNGVVHRDIKPANIVIDHRGRAKLTDFGIAQSASTVPEPDASLGTLRYMSPEQLAGKPTDLRSDIFSLGIVLHEMLTGGVPYESLEPTLLRRDILAGTTRVSDRLPTPLRAVCTKALSRDPQNRQQSAAAFAVEVRRAAAPDTSGRPGWVVMLALLALAGILGGAAWRWLSAWTTPRSMEPVEVSRDELLAEATNLFFQHKHAEAEERFTAYLEHVPDDAEAIMRRGLSRTGRGAFAAGVEDFTRALELEPRDATLHKHRAMALASMRRFEPAIGDYETAISLDPDDRETRESFGACYSIMAAEKADRKEFAAAAELMTKAIAAYPHSPVFYHQRGSCYFHSGEYEKALADLDEAIRREPRKPEHYENRGHTLNRLNRAEEAERAFKKAAELRNP